MRNKFFLLLLILFLTGCSQSANKEDNIVTEFKPSKLRVADFVFELEIADNTITRTKGLSGKEELAENYGMLFIFEDYLVPGFWMKDMLVAIDIIWIRDDVVVGLHENLPPPDGPNEVLDIYKPFEPVNRVLEVKAGTVEKLGIKKGDKVEYLDY